MLYTVDNLQWRLGQFVDECILTLNEGDIAPNLENYKEPFVGACTVRYYRDRLQPEKILNYRLTNTENVL